MGWKEKEIESMADLHNWDELAEGFYRYKAASNASYEVQIKFRYLDEPFADSLASLYLAITWKENEYLNWFRRKTLLKKKPLFDCVAAAIDDFKKNTEEIK